MQTSLEVGDDAITGTLKYIADYSSAGYTGEEASGNFMVIKCEVPDIEGATIQAGCNNLSTLDSDGIVVVRIADKDTQTLKVVARKAGYNAAMIEYDLSGLTCNES